MFREIIDRIKEGIEYIMKSRLMVLIIVFCLTSTVLIGRLKVHQRHGHGV